jgi:hypothetical protein
MDFISKLEDLKNFGIDLKLEGLEMEAFYSKALVKFFNQKTGLSARPIDDWEFEAWVNDELVSTVLIQDSVLRINPISEENAYVIVMDVLEFVAKMHKPTVELYRSIAELSESHEEPEEESEEDSDEWI